MIDLFKYSIVSTAIATVTLVIADLFKEREYDKNEMLAFNDYIPYIVDTTGTIDKKIYLCRFFSAVTPEGDLRNGWQNYTNFLENEKVKIEQLVQKTNQKSQELNYKSTPPTNDEIQHLEDSEVQRQKIIADLNITDTNNYLVNLGADTSTELAKPEVDWASKFSSSATIYKKGNWYRTVIPVNTSFGDDKDLAEKIKFESKGKKAAYVVSSKTWCNNTEFSAVENCIICK